MQATKSKTSLLYYLSLLTGLFCALQISFMIQTSGMYFEDVKFIATHISIPLRAVPGVIFYVFAQLLLQVAYTLIIWLQARLCGLRFRLSEDQVYKFAFTLWALTTIFMLFANAYIFPNSKYANFLALFFLQDTIKLFYYVLANILLLVAVFSLLGALRHKPKSTILILVILTLAFFPTPPHIAKDASSATHPNIILIGVDALRPDFLGYFGGSAETPHLDNFLNQSFVFGDALTPLARTFPSWVSIFTGLYPKQTHARFDLALPGTLDISKSFPKILQANGYETIYGMDDTRFSNITPDFGFDKFVTPPVGFNDFFIGSFNDFPLSNLVINTRLGKWLFPYNYANRAVYITYQPNSYIEMWRQTLQKDRNKPLFIAVHFCLTHYPYFWGSYAPIYSKQFPVHYVNAIQEMDNQFQAFFNLLKQQNILQHSIIVLLSDHGEALEFDGDRITEKDLYVPGASNPTKKIARFYPPTFQEEKVGQSAGHGTDVLGLPQYHSVLAFRVEGLASAKPHPDAIDGLVNLMQIKPTILNFLHLANEPNGLEEILQGKKLSLPWGQDFFMESDFSPEAVRTVHPETKQLLFAGINFFQIDPKTTFITIKKSMADMIMSSKQYADIYNGWMFALYPQTNHHYTPILVNLQTGKWTDDMNTAFALHSPYVHMLAALKSFYGNDIN